MESLDAITESILEETGSLPGKGYKPAKSITCLNLHNTLITTIREGPR